MNKFIFLLFTAVTIVSTAFASHIKSYQGYYTYRPDLGPDTYEFVIHTYWECDTEVDGNILADLDFTIYDQGGTEVVGEDFDLIDTVVYNLEKRDKCIDLLIGSNCFKQVNYGKIVSGLSDPGGYLFTIMNCNRADADNLDGASNNCAIWSMNIVTQNSSPTMDNIPNPFVCIGDSVTQNLGLFDVDGDSLSFELAPILSTDQVTVFSETYSSGGYSQTLPLGTSNYISVDPVTGEITTVGGGNLGTFLVGIAVNEHRNGQIINTSIMEIAFAVTAECPSFSSGEPSGGIDFGTRCGNVVQFENNSRGGHTYSWDFGVEGTDTDISSEFSPTFTYPSGGTYTVTFVIADEFFGCVDTLQAEIRIETPDTKIGFETKCLNDPIVFLDSSRGAFGGTINKWEWFFGDGETYVTTDPNEQVSHEYDQAENWKLMLVTHDANGCGTDTLRKTIVAPASALAKVEADPANAAKPGDTISLIDYADNYSTMSFEIWHEGVLLGSFDTVPHIVPFELEGGDYEFVQNVVDPVDASCNASDTLVYKMSNGQFKIPNAFTPDGNSGNDNTNDKLYFIAREVSDFYFVIYNQWGEVMYETTDPDDGNNNPWDGTYKGKLVPAGAYPFYAKAKDLVTQSSYEDLRGTILVIR